MCHASPPVLGLVPATKLLSNFNQIICTNSVQQWLNKREFHENRVSECRILLKGSNGFLSLLPNFCSDLGKI
jgi:hypothetical protein